jgi:hypothetical protein
MLESFGDRIPLQVHPTRRALRLACARCGGIAHGRIVRQPALASLPLAAIEECSVDASSDLPLLELRALPPHESWTIEGDEPARPQSR